MSVKSRLRLSVPMVRVLCNYRDGLPACFHVRGMSAHGGHTAVMMALRNRKLIGYDNELTDEGRKAVAELWPPQRKEPTDDR